jgi:hypothetical protein
MCARERFNVRDLHVLICTCVTVCKCGCVCVCSVWRMWLCVVQYVHGTLWLTLCDVTDASACDVTDASA